MLKKVKDLTCLKVKDSERISKIITEKNNLTARFERLVMKKASSENEVQHLNQKIRNLEGKLHDQKSIVARERKENGSNVNALNNKIKKQTNELNKKDKLIKNLQNMVEGYQKKQTKGMAVGVANSMEITSSLQKNGPSLYTSAAGDFVNMMSANNKSAFDKLKEENNILRTALQELQKMMIEVIETRKSISKQNLQNLDLDPSSEVKDIKEELFNIQGTPLSTNTLLDIRNNITKFKSFLKKCDDKRTKGLNLENMDLSNLSQKEQINLNALKNMIMNAKYVTENQENLIKRSIKKIKAKKPQIDVHDMRRKLDGINSRLGLTKNTLVEDRNKLSSQAKDFESLQGIISDVFDRLSYKKDEFNRNRVRLQNQSKSEMSDGGNTT